MPRWDRKTILHGVCAVFFIVLIVWLSGIGAMAYQNWDHYTRNAVFDVLCDRKWPIYEQNPNGYTVSLIYYIGFWLPAAVMGKLFGTGFGYVFMALWSILGVVLFYALVCIRSRKLTVWPILLFFAFSGLDALTKLCVGEGATIFSADHLEWSFFCFQFSSFTTQLFWVFNQAIPAWLFTVLLFFQKSNRNIVFLLSLSLLSCTLPFLGMIPFAAYVMFNQKYEGVLSRREWFKKWFKDTFTVQNVVCGGAITIILALYVLSNTHAGGTGPEDSSNTVRFVWMLFPNFAQFFWRYVLFVIAEVGFHIFFVCCTKKRNITLLFVVGGVLLITPLFRIGSGYDACMRVSIPALVILYLMVYDTLDEAWHARERLVFCPLLFVLLLGAITPWHEILRTLMMTFQGYFSAGTFDIMTSNAGNFIADISDSFFYRFIAKK